MNERIPPPFPYAIGEYINEKPSSWLMQLSEHLRMLHSIALMMGTAAQLREQGNVVAALGVERTVGHLIDRLPADWRW